MSFRSLILSATAQVRQAMGFNDTAENIRSNQQMFAQAIALAPRPLRRYEAQAMLLLASHGGRYRQQARAALWLAAKAAGRHVGPSPTMEPRLCKASTARLAYWATDRGTPV